MFAVVVSFTIKTGRETDFMSLMRENASTSLRDEADCVQFDIATDPARPSDVFLYELYRDAAAFEHHKTTQHFLSFDAATADMISSKTVTTYSKVIQ